LAMKLVNFASLDPAITASGRKGLGNASATDRQVWNEFHADWDRLAVQSSKILDLTARSSCSARSATTA
jgi:hypothetical protein